jgi:hypothetical protein
VVAGLAIVADTGGLACLFLAHLPLILKLSIGAGLILIPIVATAYHAGRKRQWTAMQAEVRHLEREVRHLRGERGHLGSPARRAA